MAEEKNLEAAVEKQLREAGVRYVKEPVVGATRPDFLVTTDRGDHIVVEVKAWEPSPENTARAIHPSGAAVQRALKGCGGANRHCRRRGFLFVFGRSCSGRYVCDGSFRARQHLGTGEASATGCRIEGVAEEEGLRLNAVQRSV
jgi:hypothetical protein